MIIKHREIVELIEDNNELENYFKNTIIPQLFIDADLKLKKFTPPAMKQFSLSKKDIGKSINDIKDNFRFPTIIEDVQQVIENSEILEKEIQTTDSRWYQMNIIPYVDFKKNKLNGVIITFVEITMRMKDLRDQERIISDYETLLDTISHDIKNPLTALVVSIDVFQHLAAKTSKEFKPLINNVQSSIKKMEAIINELTDTRKKKHKYRAEEEIINFAGLLEEVRLTVMDDILRSNAIFKSEIHEMEITFSKRKLRSIVYNLVSNALKYTSPDRKPEILITTVREKGFITISVKDNGIGIAPAKQDEIFSKYYRVEHKIEGSGIGLYLVKEMVLSAGGRVSLESHPGKGSEFKVYIKT